MVLKLERFFHLSGRSFGLDSFIGIVYLSSVLSLKANAQWEMATWDLTSVPHEIME